MTILQWRKTGFGAFLQHAAVAASHVKRVWSARGAVIDRLPLSQDVLHACAPWKSARALALCAVAAGLVGGCGERAITARAQPASVPGTLTVSLLAPAQLRETVRLVHVQARYQPIEPVDPDGRAIAIGFRFVPRPSTTGLPIGGLDALSRETPRVNGDVPLRVVDRGVTFSLDTIEITLKRCRGTCETEQHRITVWCHPNHIRQVVSGDLLVAFRYVTEKERCGIERPSDRGAALQTEARILERLRGHFPGADQRETLPSTLPVLPAPGGGWSRNPTARLAATGLWQALCASNGAMSTLTPVERLIELPARQFWPLGSDVNVFAYFKPDGQACRVAVTSADRDADRPEYRYTFAGGKLVVAEVEDRDVRTMETWRYADGVPIEYVRVARSAPDQDETMWYWHAVAARDWPGRMDFKPDMRTFATHQRFATQVLEQIEAPPNTVPAP